MAEHGQHGEHGEHDEHDEPARSPRALLFVGPARRVANRRPRKGRWAESYARMRGREREMRVSAWE